MKKRSLSLAILLALALTLPALAAAQTEPAAPGGLRPANAAVSHAPTAWEEEAVVPTPIVDIPVDENSYAETPSGAVGTPRLSDGQPGRGNVEELYEYFEETGYPGHLSYVFEAGGELRDETVYSYWLVGMVDATQEQKAAILDLAAPTCLITFENAMFTHEEKVRAFEAIQALDDPNITHLVFGANTDTVWVGVPEELAKQYAKYLIGDLGLGAVVSVTDERSFAYLLTESAAVPGGVVEEYFDTGALTTGVGNTVVPAVPGGLQDGSPLSPWPFLLAGLAALALLLTARSLLLPALAGGGTWGRSRLTRGQVERAVSQAAAEPREDLFPSILKKLEE